MSVVELNEAFASQCLADLAEWPGLDPDKVNPDGARSRSATAGASARAPRRPGDELGARRGFGVAAICIGVGQGLAVAPRDWDEHGERKRIYDLVAKTPTSYPR